MLEHYKEINLYIYRLTGDKNLAQDLTQETYAKFLETNKDSDTVAKSYLYQIAKHLVIDKVRKDNLVLQTTYNEEEHSIEIEKYTEEILFEEIRKRELKESIKNLPPQQKRVFIMFYYKNLTRKEIAKTLNITTNAVEKNITRAIAKIKEDITKDD
ncbi:RNA polymerase sigma factor [Aliarcobacter vitoriensis]|uniref:RNA polymerase subunit sigma n=1 Tax=Aliarcobacter vitoriensis TaxID=2011099 RepID=A0A366MSH7_9BACT|nr:sigma-70 family RNA polymerase sigma factor [Aliarcobacter vitoriensis]RBQ28987.1 RNA polymerase subunit sigma [Aliarcobacter vitoriensis]RBQ31175.1 RNA polymerase subunit sigma [Arcobacter sp. FW59]